jgi:hypothetical protein
VDDVGVHTAPLRTVFLGQAKNLIRKLERQLALINGMDAPASGALNLGSQNQPLIQFRGTTTIYDRPLWRNADGCLRPEADFRLTHISGARDALCNHPVETSYRFCFLSQRATRSNHFSKAGTS